MFKMAIPVLHVSNVDDAERLYFDQLGFEKRSEYRADAKQSDPAYVVIERDGAWLHLSSFSGDAVPGGVAVIIVSNVDRLYEELRAKQVVIDSGPVDQTWGNREMYVKDLDGNSLRFVQLPG